MLGAEDVKKQQQDNPQLYQKPDIATTNNTVTITGIDELQVANHLGIASMEAGKYSQEIKNIIDWAKANGAKTLDDILYEVRYLSNMLGSNAYEKKIKTISRYVFLANEKTRIATEMDRMKEL
jgi:hypothetical protein